MIVISDIDDVLIPWAMPVHEACVAAGLAKPDQLWTQWAMHDDYGCAKEQWLAVVDSLVIPNGIYHAPPYPGAAEALRDLKSRGHDLYLVTARGFMSHAEEIRDWTVEWKNAYRIPGKLFFIQDKGTFAKQIGATHAIDDRVENARALKAAGCETYLMNQPHNLKEDWDPEYRVDSAAEFVERLVDNA